MKLKELNQNDFAMKIVEDLGMKPSRGTSARMVRFAVFECTTCKVGFETVVSSVKASKQSECKSCSQKTHGLHGTVLYSRYSNMMTRCYNKNNSKYASYGATGVTVCEEWKNSFQAYSDWCMKNGYKKHLELDKDIGSKKLGIFPAVYSPETCTFVTSEENAKHKSLLTRSNTSGYRGVTIHKDKFKATINVDDSFVHLGLWTTALDAAKAYDYYVVSNNLDRSINSVLGTDEKVDLDLASKPRSSNKSGFIGVYKKGNKFAAECNTSKGVKKYLGTFDTPQEASTYRESFIDSNILQLINKRNKI